MNPVQKLLIGASGADTNLLKKPECATERKTYAMIGVSVIVNGVLSSLSGGYALFTVFKDVTLAGPLGLLYGGLIFNIDRFFVATTRKEKKPSAFYYVTLFIRCGLAMSIGFVVAKPLELKIFQKEIQAKTAQENLKIQQQTLAQLDLNFAEIDTLKTQRQDIEQKVEKQKQRRDNAFSSAMAENDGTRGTLRPGTGPVFAQKMEEYERINQDYQKFNGEAQKNIDSLDSRIATLTAKKDKELAKINSIQENSDGFLTQLEMLELLGEEKPIVARVSFAITLLFIALDTAPILAKFLLKRGIYDAVLDKIQTEKMEEQDTLLKIARKQQEFYFDEYQEAIKASFNNSERAKMLEEVASKMVENSREQLMTYINQEHNYPDTKLKEVVEEAYDKQIKEMAKAEVKRKVIETKANNVVRDTINRMRIYLKGL